MAGLATRAAASTHLLTGSVQPRLLPAIVTATRAATRPQNALQSPAPIRQPHLANALQPPSESDEAALTRGLERTRLMLQRMMDDTNTDDYSDARLVRGARACRTRRNASAKPLLSRLFHRPCTALARLHCPTKHMWCDAQPTSVDGDHMHSTKRSSQHPGQTTYCCVKSASSISTTCPHCPLNNASSDDVLFQL